MSEARPAAPPPKPKPAPAKPGLHPRNRDLAGYDFPALAATSPGLARYLVITPVGSTSIDFANPAAVKAFNRALLMHHYGVQGWRYRVDSARMAVIIEFHGVDTIIVVTAWRY